MRYMRALHVRRVNPKTLGLKLGTFAVDNKNAVFFFDDIYGYDKLLDEALRKGYPYPTA